MHISIPFKIGQYRYKWNYFVKPFINAIKRVVFNHTNFNIGNEYDHYDYYNYYNYLSTGYISFTVTFYEYYMWDYNSTDENEGELLQRRLLQSEEIDWKKISSPYVYIRAILSYLNPAAIPVQPEEEETTSEDDETLILDSLPEELKSFISKYPILKEKLLNAAEQIPKAFGEVYGKAREINDIEVYFDTEKGLEFTEDIIREYPTPPPPKEDDKPWVEEYWWVILLICVGVVLIIAIITVIIFRVKKRKQAKVSIEN